MPETIVDSGTVPMAAHDFGGAGRPLLLLHGAGGNLTQMAALARLLRPEHRVVTVDLRGHGRSGDGRWDWDEVLTDLAAVASDLGLHRPAVVGVSLGGMVATLWAQRHPECAGAVSLDGTPPPSRPEQLAGMDAQRAAGELDRLRAVFDQMAAMLAEQQPFHELYAAYRRATAERISTVDNPHLRVRHLAGASHAMVAENPGLVASLITDFLTDSRTGFPTDSLTPDPGRDVPTRGGSGDLAGFAALRRVARHTYGADAYEQARPDYPQRVYEVLRSRCGPGPAW